MVMVILIISFLILSYILYRYGDSLFQKNKKPISSENLEMTNKLNQLFNELKNEKLEFKIVSPEIMYSKTFGSYLKLVSALTASALTCLLLDIIFHGTSSITQNSDQIINFSIAYAFFVFIFFGLTFSNMVWKYQFFKNGLINPIKNTDIIDEYITANIKNIIRNYFVLSIVSYLLGTTLAGSGYITFTAATILYGLFIFIYSHMEFNRIGFAPIFNLLTEKLDQLKGVKNVKSSQ